MKLNIEKQDYIEADVDFVNDKEMVKVEDKRYELKYELKNYEKVLYSLPTNDKHNPYSKRTNISIDEERKDIVNQHWTPFKQGQTIIGKIVNDKFIVKR